MSEPQSQNSSKPQTPVVADPEEDLNPRESDYVSNKSFLLSSSSKSGLNLYDHLVVCLKKILEEKPQNVVDIFEEISRESKRSRFTSNVDTVRNQRERNTEVELADLQKKLFQVPRALTDEGINDEDAESPLPDLMQTAFLFEQAGIGLEREELYKLWLSMQELQQQQQCDKLRFWGKLLGTKQNYYVLEATMKSEIFEEEIHQQEQQRQREQEQQQEQQQQQGQQGETAGEAEDEDTEPTDLEDIIPQPDYKPPPKIPSEDPGTGANKFVYFVCNHPGEQWVRLPHVTPEQIQISRKIKKFFTGYLDADVVSYPPFPGNESNFLRAQIARISAGTQISPSGLYIFDEEEEEDEEDGGRDSFVENPEFEPMSVRELIDPSLASWTHHTQYLLPQGRTKWWNPVQKSEEEAEEDEEDEEQEEMDEPQPEEGPPLLTPLSEDEEIDGMAPWTAKMSSNLIPQYAVAVLSSNAWPGASAVCVGRTFENVYIGWGQRYATDNYSPPPPPAVQVEFPSGPEITETEDPTPEEEAAVRAALAEAEEGEEEGEGEEEEEEDEDED